MDAHSRSNRALGAIVASWGLCLLALAAGALVRVLPNLGSADPHTVGEASVNAFIGGLVGVAGLLTLLVAWRLWRGRRGARTFAAALTVVAGLFSWMMLTTIGNVLWAVRIIVFEPDAWLVRWPYLYWDPYVLPGPDGIPMLGAPLESFPFGRLDDVAFWVPGIIAIGVLVAAGLLLAGWVSRRTRGARSD